MSGPRFDEIEGEVEEAPGVLTSIARGAKQGITRGFGDEISGMAGAVGHVWGRAARRVMDGDVLPDSLDELGQELEGIQQAYRTARDDIREEDDAAERANPLAFGGAELAANVATSLPLGGATVGAAARMGAAEGALSGLGRSRADLTEGDVYDYVRAFEDTAMGAGFGAAGGAAGHYVGRGLQKLGEKARGALHGARGELFEQEARKGIQEFSEAEEREIARRTAQRATAEAEEAALAKQHGQALEMNKALEKRAAREADRFANARTEADRPLQAEMRAHERPRSAPAGLAEEPGTNTLGGYEGAANRRWRDNYGKVKADRAALEGEDLAPAERARLERYVEAHADAVDNPGAFQRNIIEQELRRRYPRDVVDRIMAERVGPNGEILPRPRATPAAESVDLPGMDDLTSPGDMFDAVRRGDPRAGGGGSAFASWPEDARTLVDPDMAAVRPRETFAPLPQRKAGTMPEALDRGGKPGPLNMEATPMPSEAEALVREAEEAMARRRAAAFSSGPEAPAPVPEPTVRMAGGEDTVPDARPPTMGQRPPRPSPPVAGAETPRGFEALRSPAMERAMAREREAGGVLAKAAWDGAVGGQNILGAVLGGIHGFGASAAIGGAQGVIREAMRNPAARARLISALRLAHLQRANPAVFARVGRGLLQALNSKDPGSVAVFEHVLLQSDPEYRVAHQEAEEATRDLSDEELVEELVAAGVL